MYSSVLYSVKQKKINSNLTSDSSETLQIKMSAKTGKNIIEVDMLDNSDNSNDLFESPPKPGENSNSHLPKMKSSESFQPFESIAVPEKIIFCLDLSNQNQVIPFRTIKRCIDGYAKTKAIINSDHEFSLLTFDDKRSSLKCEWTTPQHLRTILNTLEQSVIKTSQSENFEFNFDSFYEELHEAASEYLPETSELAPRYIVRAIFIYNRRNTIYISTTLPKLERCLFFDTIWIQDAKEKDENFQQVKTFFDAIEEEYPWSYHLRVNGANNLYKAFTKLYAHPSQRRLQKDLVPTLSMDRDQIEPDEME